MADPLRAARPRATIRPRSAVRFAAAAGALAVTKRGAQDAMPDRAEVERLLAAQPADP